MIRGRQRTGAPGTDQTADPELPDEKILSRSFKEPALFAILVDRYEEMFLRKAKYILKNERDAEDIVQDTFVKIYLNGKRFKPVVGASFKSWAFKILINCCFTAFKRVKREREFRAELEPKFLELIPATAEVEAAEARLDRDVLLSAMSRLPNMLRKVVSLHFISGKPQKEVADIVGISVGAVRARIYRAKKALQKINNHHNGTT